MNTDKASLCDPRSSAFIGGPVFFPGQREVSGEKSTDSSTERLRGGWGERRRAEGTRRRPCEAAFLSRPGLAFAPETLVAVLHALFDHGPDLRVAALPFGESLVAEVGQVGDAHFAGEKAADREIAEAGDEGGPAAVGGGVTGGPGDAVEDLLLQIG